jgi:hypothetical protein
VSCINLEAEDGDDEDEESEETAAKQPAKGRGGK